MDHDRLFKQLLRTYFGEFVELFLPEVDAYLDRSSIEFLDKEVFTDVAGGDRHEVDLVAKARFRGEAACFLVHVEAQAAAREAFAKRMFRYFARLYEQFDLPVYPVAVLSYDAPARPEPDEHVVEFPDRLVLRFGYRAVQLNRLNWRDFARRPNPVAAALMTKMRIDPADRPRVMLECLRMIATLKLDPARQSLIRQFMSAYLRLSAAEVRAYNEAVRQIDPPEREAVMQIVDQFEEWGEAKGMAKGRAKGMAKGLAEGEQRAAAAMVLRQLRRRFGPVPADLESRIAAITTPELEALGEALLDFGSLADADAWLRRPPG
jgi:predicted transposase YdaD